VTSFEHGIRYELDGHVARVTIDRPNVLNAVDRAAHQELQRVWADIEASSDVRVVVLTGAGDRSFCVGADVSAAGVDKTGMEYWADLDPDGFGGLSLRESLDVPVIARVNGYALGGGMEMVLGCDIVVAADSARFGLTEPRIGRLPLDGGMVRLPRQIPYHQAMGLLLTGRKAPAEEMHRLGLVNEVVPAADLDDAVQRWVDDVLACAPLSLKAIKQTVQRTAHLTAREANTVRLPALVAALQSKDQDEGVRAFQEKRAPEWTGS
jgi:enoyl-CoA hydratase/carnithine racemase